MHQPSVKDQDEISHDAIIRNDQQGSIISYILSNLQIKLDQDRRIPRLRYIANIVHDKFNDLIQEDEANDLILHNISFFRKLPVIAFLVEFFCFTFPILIHYSAEYRIAKLIDTAFKRTIEIHLEQVARIFSYNSDGALQIRNVFDDDYRMLLNPEYNIEECISAIVEVLNNKSITEEELIMQGVCSQVISHKMQDNHTSDDQNIGADPENHQDTSTNSHVKSCDPVINGLTNSKHSKL